MKRPLGFFTRQGTAEAVPGNRFENAASAADGISPEHARFSARPLRRTGLVAQALLPVRSCHVEREEPPPTAASHTTKILIANLELEFQLTYRKLSPLRISNRKFSPAFASSILLAIPLHGCEQIERHSPLVAVRSNLRFRD